MLLLRNPALVALLLGLLVALVAFVVVRATWTPRRARSVWEGVGAGARSSASGSMYVRHAAVFLGIGLLLIPITVVITLLQWLALEGLELISLSSTGESAGGAALFAVIIGTTLALLGLGLVQAATACALLEIDAGRQIAHCPRTRWLSADSGLLLGAIGLFVLVWVVLTTTAFLIPVAIWLAVRWCLLAPVVEGREGRRPGGATPQQTARARPLVAHRLARRPERRDLARRRPAARRAADLRRRRAAGAAQHRRRDRLRGGAPVRRARYRIRLLRRAHAGLFEPVVDERELPAEIEVARA